MASSLSGEVFHVCKRWERWEDVCDLMIACLPHAPPFEVWIQDPFFTYLSSKFHNSHIVWSHIIPRIEPKGSN